MLSRTLTRGGYHVDVAATSSELKQKLREGFYHLLVLDIRMEDAVPENVVGMDLLRELKPLLGTSTKVVMLSSYGSQEQMREAFREHDVEDFMSKEEFDNFEFLAQVDKIFVKTVRINFDMELHWHEIADSEDAVTNIWIGDEKVHKNSPIRSRVAAELEDLLRRLFPEAVSIIVRPLKPGVSGAKVLWVQPFFEAGGSPPVVVKFGEYTVIEKEYQNYKQFVEPFVGGGRITSVRMLQRTPLLGGIVYALLGATHERMQDFGQFYRQATIEQIKTVLDDLFNKTCGGWYANRGNLAPLNLAKDYEGLLRFSHDKLRDAFEQRLKSVQGKARLQFTSLSVDRRFTNPLVAVIDRKLIYSTYKCITHGDFNAENILIDEKQQTWLIDFLRTGTGHILRDVAELDTVIRIQLLHSEEASLDERLYMEETLLSCKQFSQLDSLLTRFPTENAPLRKACTSVIHLRKIARQWFVHSTSKDMDEYYAALLYYAVNLIRFYSVPTTQREHAFLSASLIADHLKL